MMHRGGPVIIIIFHFQIPPEMLGYVTHLSFCDTHSTGGGTTPTVFASTMGSFLIKYCLTLPDTKDRLTQINTFSPAGKCTTMVSGVRSVVSLI